MSGFVILCLKDMRSVLNSRSIPKSKIVGIVHKRRRIGIADDSDRSFRQCNNLRIVCFEIFQNLHSSFSESNTELRVISTRHEIVGSRAIRFTNSISTFEIMEGNWVAEAMDASALLGTDDLVKHQNKFVSFKGMTVEPSVDGAGNEAAYLYKWDGSGQDGDDLYFNVSLNGNVYNFTVESYLCDNSTEVYKAVQALEIGQTVDMEGFLYWYEGANPHITSVKVK